MNKKIILTTILFSSMLCFQSNVAKADKLILAEQDVKTNVASVKGSTKIVLSLEEDDSKNNVVNVDYESDDKVSNEDLSENKLDSYQSEIDTTSNLVASTPISTNNQVNEINSLQEKVDSLKKSTSDLNKLISKTDSLKSQSKNEKEKLNELKKKLEDLNSKRDELNKQLEEKKAKKEAEDKAKKEAEAKKLLEQQAINQVVNTTETNNVSSQPIVTENSGTYTASQFKSAGVINQNGIRYTYYNLPMGGIQSIASSQGLTLSVRSDGVWVDNFGRVVVAYGMGSMRFSEVSTPLGTGIVLDSCPSNACDIAVTW